MRPGDCLNVAILALGDAARLRSALGDYTARLLANELDPPPDEAPNPAEGEEPGPSRNPAASPDLQPDATQQEATDPNQLRSAGPPAEQREEQVLMGYVRHPDETPKPAAPSQSIESPGAGEPHASKTAEAVAPRLALWELQSIERPPPIPEERATFPLLFTAMDGASTASPTTAQEAPEEDELELWWEAQRLDEMDALVVGYAVEEGEPKAAEEARDLTLAALSDRCAHRALPLFVTRLHPVAQQKKRDAAAADGEAQEMRSYTTYEITRNAFRKLLNEPAAREQLPVMDERLFLSDLLGLEKKAQKAIRLSLAVVLTRFQLSAPPFAEHLLDIAAMAWGGPPVDSLLLANRATRQVHAVRLERGVRTRVSTVFSCVPPWTPLGLLSLGEPRPAELPLIGEAARVAQKTGGPEFLLLEGELHDGVAVFRVLLLEWRQVPDLEAKEPGALKPSLVELEICKMGTISGYKWLPGASLVRLGSGYVLAAALYTESIHVYYVEPRQVGWTPRHGGHRLFYVTYMLLEGAFLGMDVLERAPAAEKDAEMRGERSLRTELQEDSDLKHVHSHESVLVGVYRSGTLRLERALVSVRSAMDHLQPLVSVPLVAIPEATPFIVIPRDALSDGLLLLLDPDAAFGAVTVYAIGCAPPKRRTPLEDAGEHPTNGEQIVNTQANDPATQSNNDPAKASPDPTPSAATVPNSRASASATGDQVVERLTDPSVRRAREQEDQLRATLEGRAQFQRGQVRIGAWTEFAIDGHERTGTTDGGGSEIRLAAFDRSTKSLLIYRCVRRKKRV